MSARVVSWSGANVSSVGLAHSIGSTYELSTSLSGGLRAPSTAKRTRLAHGGGTLIASTSEALTDTSSTRGNSPTGILQHCTIISRGILGCTPDSRRGLKDSFRGVHNNFLWSSLDLLIRSRQPRTFVARNLEVGCCPLLSIGNLLDHSYSKSSDEARHFSLSLFGRLENCRIRLIHKPLQSLAGSLRLLELLLFLCHHFGGGGGGGWCWAGGQGVLHNQR